LLISFEEKDGKVQVYVVSDLQQDLSATLVVKIIDFEGKKKFNEEEDFQIARLSSEIYHVIDIAGISKKEHVLVASLISADSLLGQNLYYFLPPKLLELPLATISSEIVAVEKGYEIEVTTDKLAKNVFVSLNLSGHFSANFFDLLPKETMVIFFETNAGYEDFIDDLRIITLNELGLVF
jgi:beta-mannosidase